LILWPASDNAQFMRPVIVNRFPTPTLSKQEFKSMPFTFHPYLMQIDATHPLCLWKDKLCWSQSHM